MPKIDLGAVAPHLGGDYPHPHEIGVAARCVRQLSEAGGLADFVVNHLVLPPGALSSQRHWHEREDEFVVILAGTAVLIDDAGETSLAAGDCLAFPKGDANGHTVRAGPQGCSMLAMSHAEASPVHYPDIDMLWDDRADRYTHRDGTPYPAAPGNAS